MSTRRGISRKNAAASLLTLVVVFVAGLCYLVTGLGSGGVPADPTTTPAADISASPSPVVAAPTAPGAGATWWQVYFTDPLRVNNPSEWQGSIEGRLIDLINSAQNSIHIASFEFDLTPVAEALIAARGRGVDVRWVTDNENGLEADAEPDRGQFAMLQNAGIEVHADDRAALMHNKFWIFDSQIVWTGSTNITQNGVFKQDNNTIVIHSPQLAIIYEREFQEMWNGQFGPRSPSQLNEQTMILDGSQIVVVFTPEDPALENAIIPIVKSAAHSIRFLAFSFTDYPLADAMSQDAQSGVNVAGVFEKVGSGTDAAELRTLFCRNVPVRVDGNPSFMHNKVIIVDDRIVITGSLNFSTSAEVSNDENVLIIDNAEIARQYLQDFERVWNLATSPDPVDVKCQ
jgi:phosphatidylserine/phosphatidylglycerophosphate/cardiolipin synthase-like enzyme